jgi:hypothetical protein
VLLFVAFLVIPHAVGAQGAIRFDTIAAQGDFPTQVLFSVVVEGDAEIVNLELSYRVAGSPYTQSRWPDFAHAQRVETSFRLDTQVEFYNPGTEFHYYWKATDAAGRVAESPEQVWVYEDNRFTWQAVRTDRIAVYWYEGEQSFGQDVLDTASRTLDRLEKDAGVRASQPIRIYLYASNSDFRGVLGPNASEWIGGQAIPPLGIIVANIAPGDEREVKRIVPHEVSHVVLYQATHNPYAGNPNWLEEGIAVHNQEVADADFPALVEAAARDGQLIPLRALSSSFPSDADLALLSYAESSSIIDFILQRYGKEGLARLVSVFSEGETSDGAIQRALGVSLDDLEAEWRATLPAAERTPVPGATPQSRSTPTTGSVETVVRILASGMACIFLAAIGVVVAAIVIIVRRQRRQDREQGPPAPPPYPPA